MTTRANTKTQHQEHLEGDVTSLDVWQQRVEHALRHLGDRSVLNRSPLARLSYIESLSTARYNGHPLPRGLALHDILISCAERVSNELSNEPALAKACAYLRLLSTGVSRPQISKELGLSREHVRRVYRRKAIAPRQQVTKSGIRRITYPFTF